MNRYDLKEMLINIDDELLIAANFYSVYKRFNSGNDLNNLSDTFLMQLSKPKIYWKFLNLYKSSKCYKHGKNTS